MAKKKKDDLTIEKSTADFKLAYRAKAKLIERQKADFLFALGEQWSIEDQESLKKAGIKPVVDNRIAPNIFLLTGLERQNRSDFKTFPEGEEDSLKSEIATALFKDAIKKSGYGFKSSEQFKDGITCGESHLELYLDYTESMINAKPVWQKCDGNAIFPDPASREYDFSDARYVYKIKLDVEKEDLINLYPDAKKALEAADSGKIEFSSLGQGAEGIHRQPRDYNTRSGSDISGAGLENKSFDLIERYYKKWVEKVFVGDKQTGEIKEVEGRDKADGFISEYQGKIADDQALYEQTAAKAVLGHVQANPHLATAPFEQQIASMQQSGGQLPPPPPEQDPARFIVIKRQVPEMWCFAHTPGVEEPLADERAWFYPKWKNYPFIPYFARFSTAPLTGDQRHLLVQGIVHGVKGAQEKHNKAEMLMLRHLNSSANSGWLAHEDSWVDPEAVKNFGTAPGINLEWKGQVKPERITPGVLSQGHAQIAAESAESVKAQLGMNSDLIAAQQGGGDSGRAIALRQKQGLLMVQELFDNLSRSRVIAGRFLLSQLGEMYDTETATKVLGEAFMQKNFPAPMLMNEQTMQQEPMKDKFGQPMPYDKDLAELALTEVLSGELGNYDVTVGEAVSSETQLLASSMELKDIATTYPGVIPPDVLIRHSQIPEAAKKEIISSIQQAQQAAQQAQAMTQHMPPHMPHGPAN